jgi:endonuclease YncB( thermonuclease family)
MSKKTLVGFIVAAIIAIIAVTVATDQRQPPAIAQTYTLTIHVTPPGAGSISPPGGEYDSGVQITLTASPSGDYTFDYWSGDASGTPATVTITMDSDKDVTAYFQEKPPTVEATVTRVVDGDTIVVSLEGITYRVRYIGIDTPETVHPSEPVECFGKEASDKNSELVAGKTVRLEKDISDTDRYGRLLRYVWVGDIFVNDYLVRQGYAYASTYPPDVKYAQQFAQAQSEAEANNRGLWAACE